MNLSDAKTYFKQPVFQRLAKELWRRYWLKGDFGHSFGLHLLEDVDQEPLQSFLGATPVVWRKKKRLMLAEFQQALAYSLLNWQLEDFVVYVTGKPLALKQDAEEIEEANFNRFKVTLDTIDCRFTRDLTERQLREWHKQELADFTIFRQVALALEHLPQKEFLRLPVFAYQITGNPHEFDENQAAGQLFLQMLTAMSKQTAENLAALEVAEQRHGRLAEFYLLKDDIMNYAAIRGLTAFDSEGAENQMWRQACMERVSWNVPLKEILRMETIRPQTGHQVLVVENSGIYSILVELLPQIPIVCSSGQFTFAIWQLLRKLAAGGTKIYYSGDMDPEGLGMAQKLKTAFGQQLQFVAMNPQNFQRAKTSTQLSHIRLKKLQHLSAPTLVDLGVVIQTEEKVAYQEGFLEALMEEVAEIFAQ